MDFSNCIPYFVILANSESAAKNGWSILNTHVMRLWPSFIYCKFGNFCKDFIFTKLRIVQSFVKIKSSYNGEITLPFTDIGKACHFFVNF